VPTTTPMMLVVAVLLGGCAGQSDVGQRGPPPTVGQRPPRTCPAPCGWRPVAMPRLGVSTTITGMVAVNPNDVWVAALTGAGWSKPRPGLDVSWDAAPQHDVMLHRTAAGWSQVPIPVKTDPITHLQAVAVNHFSASGPANVWAIAGDQQNTLIHWDGARWTLVTPPSTGGSSLVDVVALAPDDVWVAGAGFTDTGSFALVEHWNGQRWRRVPIPTVTDRLQLSAITATSASDVWVFGSYATGDAAGGHTDSGMVIEHWDGHHWRLTRQTVYHNSRREFSIRAATMLSPTDGWAVGSQVYRNGGGAQQLFLHWNGTQWQIVRTRFCCAQTELESISATSPTDVWTAGFAGTTTNGYSSRVDHWNGTTWQRIPAPSTGATSLQAIAALPTGVILIAGVAMNDSGTQYPVLETTRRPTKH
jgi:hypothetical protein